MKSYAIIAAMLIGMTSAAYAECDTKKADRDVDKQARCSEKCEDNWLSLKNTFNANFEKLTNEATACFEKCSCSEHGAAFLKKYPAGH